MSNIKYKLIKRQSSSNCGLTWNDLLPTVYLVGSIVENPSNCTSEESVRYRYVQVPMSEAFDCDTETFTKYQIAKKQYSYDGNVWFDVSPLEFVRSGDTEEFSIDCGAEVTIYEWFNLDPNEDWYCVCDEADETNYYETFDNVVPITILDYGETELKDLDTLEIRHRTSGGGVWYGFPVSYCHFIINPTENLMLKFKAYDGFGYVYKNGELLEFDENREINITVNEPTEFIFGTSSGQYIYDGITDVGKESSGYIVNSVIQLIIEDKYIVIDDACGNNGYLVTRHVNEECESYITKVRPFNSNVQQITYVSKEAELFNSEYERPLNSMSFYGEERTHYVNGVDKRANDLSMHYDEILPQISDNGMIGVFTLTQPFMAVQQPYYGGWYDYDIETVILPCMDNIYYLRDMELPKMDYIDFSFWNVGKVRNFYGIVDLNRIKQIDISGWELGDKFIENSIIATYLYYRDNPFKISEPYFPYDDERKLIMNDIDIELYRKIYDDLFNDGKTVRFTIHHNTVLETNIPMSSTTITIEATSGQSMIINDKWQVYNERQESWKQEPDSAFTSNSFDLLDYGEPILLSCKNMFFPSMVSSLWKTITRVVELPDTRYVTDMSGMFSSCSTLLSIDCLNTMNTSSVKTMKFMFQDTSFSELDLSTFDVSNVEDMSYMFNICSNLEKLNLSNWDLKSDVLTENMFHLCNKLSCIVMANCSQETKDIIQAALDAVELVSVCIVDNEDDCPSAEDNLTIKYTTTDNQKLTTLNTNIPIASHTFENGVGKILLENGDALRYRNFDWQHTLKTISLPDGIMAIGDSFFNGCENLEEATWSENFQFLPSFNMCSSLKSVNIPSGVTSIGNNAFNGCTSLTSINIPSGVTSISYRAFQNCRKLANIEYYGTKAQFTAITKYNYWKLNVPTSCIVHCTDGDFPISDFR